jgi:hypothetical protein
MTLNEIHPEDEDTGPRRTATDRAVAAVESMVDASSRVGNAYADAYQEAVINLADFRGKLGDDGAASRQLSRAYMDAYEQVVLCRADVRDEAPTSGNGDTRSVGSTRHGIGCEVTRAYVDAARRMLS